MSLSAIFKKVLWAILIGSIAVAIFRNAGSVDNIYPWLVKESNQAQHFFTNLSKKYPTDKLKPLHPLPIFSHSPSASPTP